MKKKKGFTLVELLAVIVILAVILVIAVPKITDTIKNSKIASFESSAKTIAAQAEKKKMEKEILEDTGSINCSDVVKLNDTDYGDCSITFDDKGNAKVSIIGKGKFEGLQIINGTKDIATAMPSKETDVKFFTYSDVVVKDYTVTDIDKCVNYLKENLFFPDDVANSICTNGDTLNSTQGQSILELLKYNVISSDNYENAGLMVNDIEGISIESYNVDGGINVIIPSRIENKDVVEIGITAFAGLDLANVIIPDTVKVIANTAFIDNKLTNLTIPSSVIYIGRNAFVNNNLVNINIPNFVKHIGVNAFNYNLLPDEQAYIYARNNDGSVDKSKLISYGGANKNVVIPSNVKVIAGDTFFEAGLTSIDIPSSVVFIGVGAFARNNLPDNQAFIYERNSDGSIDNTKLNSYGGANKNVVIPNGIKEISEGAFQNSKITSVLIPNTVATIGEFAFSGNNLTNITIPNGVTSIGNNAFNYNQLTNVTIPSSVTIIDYNAFVNNPNLTKIVNKTGKAFDWNSICGATSGAAFVTGTVKVSDTQTIEIVAE
ncbi:MAG: leucine-rich repeat protein [Tenericutes bacterium]|nr:leucine-rich repeat protein [Mycoplasmatota bacterium]